MPRTDKLKPEYLDLRLPGRAVAQLRKWGAHLGMSAEGMARMVLLMRVHEMTGDDATLDVDEVPEHADDGAQSLALWRSRLQSIGVTSDELPAPVAVNGETRIYHVNSFTWPQGAVPTWEYGHVTSDGQVGASKAVDG